MNFKIKSILATAVAGLTLSGQANALTNNELFLIAYDNTTSSQDTFVAALGSLGTVTSFDGTSSVSLDFSQDANWQAFVANSNSANVKYQVLGYYTANAGIANNADELIISSTSASLPNQNNNGFNTLIGNAGNSASVLRQFGSMNSSVTGTSTAYVTGIDKDSGNFAGSNF